MKCSTNDERLASFATKEAWRSTLPMKHGCIAVCGGKIVAKGCNNYRTFSKDGLIENCCSCHAEVDVLRKCIKQNVKSKINLYVVRISDKGEYRNSAPCNKCVTLLKQHNVKMIIYSTDEGLLRKCKLIHYQNTHETGGEKAILHNRVSSKHMGNYILFRDNLQHL
tara:strand:+ start:247 stop:744 length:498 start_codon:yes stop_codon:yes gene_type:complete